MWSASEESPGTMEGESPGTMTHAKEKCEQNKNQLESLKEIMLKNKQSLKKKEEEVQEYARRLSKIKSRAKLSRRSKEGSAPCKDATQSPKSDAFVPDALEETIDDVSQAKTSKAKSTLLQKKLAENRKAFEQRSKEITETKRAVEEKVEAIRQQLDEQHSTITGLQKDQLSVTAIRPVVVTSDVMSPIQIDNIQEKENKIIELSNKILELEATVLDLQENLKEKDSVIDSKTRAVTLMTADLSKKGKTTLDTLEDTKDEMRTMQEHFVLLETSLKNKNDNLLEQLQERNNKIVELEESVARFEQQLNEQKLSESASADFSRSTMDTLVETKDAMKSMQENFVLIESSLRANNENLLQQLNEYELKLAEANNRIFNLESGIGIIKDPSVDDLHYKLEKLERSNKQLQDEKYELQKSIAEMQDKIVNRSIHGNGALMEKDNRIAELESLVEELKQSNNLLEEESKTELQKQLAHLTLKNDEYSNKITDLEKMVHDLEAEKNDIATKLPHEKSTAREDQKVEVLTKELEDLNKTMIKIKAQHRSKIKNLQKQLENFKKVSDTNAELVKLGNQVAVLEEEKGNLQLSLVDFDELKASAGDWQERIADLETKVSTQTKEIQMNIEAIAALENQKLDLMQELHASKQEIAALEAENAESENLRVTAEMKVVDLEEQLESIQKSQSGNKLESSSETYQSVEAELIKRIEGLSQENSELYNKIAKMEEKGASDSGSTESFEAIQESDKTDQLKKVGDLGQNSSGMKLNKSEEKGGSHAGSTESFETINDTDKNELLKKIDQLTQENTDLMLKLNRIEEKGSSDTGSTESFERIPEHNEGMTKIELLTQENSELVIKLTKLEEQFESIAFSRMETSKSDADTKLQIETILEENNNKTVELTKLKLQVTELIEENNSLEKRIEALSSENNDLVIRHTKLEERIQRSEAGFDVVDRSRREVDTKDQVDVLQEEKHLLEKEIKELRNVLERSSRTPSEETVNNELKSRIEELLEENGRVLAKIAEVEEFNQKLKNNLSELTEEKEGLRLKINQMMSDDVARERLELIDKLEKLNQEKESVAQERKDLHEEISTLLHKSNEELPEAQKLVDLEPQETELEVEMVATLEREIEEAKKLIAEQTGAIEEMKIKLAYKEEELEEKTRIIAEYEASGKKAESLDNELKEMLNTVEEWKHKCNEMQEKMQILESGKASIEEGFKMLQNEHELLLGEKRENDISSNLLKQQLESTVTTLESRLQDAVDAASAKDNEIASLKAHIVDKDRELSAKYTQLQNEMIAIDSLQDELNNNRIAIQEKDAALSSLSDEIANLYNVMRSKEEEIYSLRKDNNELNEKLQESKSSEEYHQLLEQIKNKDMALNEVESRLNIAAKTNEDLSVKVNNLSQRFDEIQSQLMEKQQELADLLLVKEQLDAEMTETKNDKSEAEKRVWELQGVLENQSKFVEELQTELRNGYKQIELLKIKHTEDTEMQNHRLENIIEELNNKTQECEVLRGDLQEKERLVGQNFTEEAKAILEAKVAELEQKLTESEEKIHAQLEKMKKIAATLKKKTVMCQELDARVAELEEKWTTEKDEKEAKNKQIQEVEILMREKDNKIVDLEEKLTQARNETTEAMKSIDSLTKDLESSREKMSILTQQITEMEEEIVRLRENLEATTTSLTAEKQAKEKVSSDFESYKQDIIRENEKKQFELDEVKERARELSVRMQVMETEYLEQLAQITNLKAENGLLLSKQTQINEKLEDTEKESEGRQMLIEKLQKEIAAITATSTETVTTQTQEEFTIEEATGTPSAPNCDHCEQCQTLVHTLEAKLQEREAQIENLNNELANSIDNFVQVRESIRFNDRMNQTDTVYENLENPRNGHPLEYNTLLSSFEAIKLELSNVLEENRELVEKIEGLQSANATLEAKIVAGDQSLEEIKERAEKLQSEHASNADLLKKYQERETELLSLQKELQVAEDRGYHPEEELNSQIASLEIEKQQLTEKEKFLMDIKSSLENEIESLKANYDSSQKQIEALEGELKIHKQRDIQSGTESTIVKREVSALDIAQDERDDVPPLFDASKIFGVPFAADSDMSSNKEIIRLQNLLDEKEAQYTNITQEIDHLQKQMIEERSKMLQDYNHCADELKISQEQLQAARAMQEHLEQIVTQKNMQIDTLGFELKNISLHSTVQHERQNDTDKLKELLLAKDNQIGDLRIDLNSTKEELERIIAERNEQQHSLEAYKHQIANLEGELRNSTDSELIQELEHRISDALKERDLLQLQVNDLTRSMEELKDSFEVGRNLQVEIERAHQERDEAKDLVANLTQALEDTRRSVEDKAHIEANLPIKESSLLEESAVSPKHPEDGTSKSIDESVEQVAHLEIGSTWDMGSSEKLNVDEETWGWNADDVQLVDDQHLTTIIPSVEIQLRAKVDDLEDRIKDLEAEKEKVIEENKAAQVRSGKMIKKLKEYKVLMESLQQQLKIQKSASDFYELDSAIEQELKSQISKLEKSLGEVREEHKNAVAEKDALTKRLDVVVSANERYMEMKERQDMDIEVLRIRNKELTDKIEALDKRLQQNVIDLERADDSPSQDVESVASQEVKPTHDRVMKQSIDDEDVHALCTKYREEIDDLKDEMEALAMENEQLQHFLEEQKSKLSTLESKRVADEDVSIQIVEDLNKRIFELQSMLSKSKEEYDLLRKQYEQSLMDANDQVSIMRQNADFIKGESLEKTNKLLMEISDLRQQVETSDLKVVELQTNLQDVMQAKENLEEKLAALAASCEKQLFTVNSSMAEVTDLLNVRIQEVADLRQELQRQYVGHEEEKEKLHSNMQELVQELNEKKQELENLKQSFSNKDMDLIQQQSVEAVSALVSQATQELVQKHAIEIEGKDKEIRNLKETISTLQLAMDEYLLEMQSNASKAGAEHEELELLKQSLIEKDALLGSIQSELLSVKQELTDNKKYSHEIENLRRQLTELTVSPTNISGNTEYTQNLQHEVETLRTALQEKLTLIDEQNAEFKFVKGNLAFYENEDIQLRAALQEAHDTMFEKAAEVMSIRKELETTNKNLEETKKILAEKVSLLESSNQMLIAKQTEIERLSATGEQHHKPSNIVDGMPLFRMGEDSQDLQISVDSLQEELQKKQEEIENLKYILNENTYPSIIQEMQERINCLYNEKAALESSLETATQSLIKREQQIEDLKQQVQTQNQEHVSKEETALLTRERRSTQDQDEIVRLQNELHVKEQEINELKYIIAGKLQASMEPQSDDFELREMVQRLTTELYGKEQEIQHLRTTIVELQKEVTRGQEFEKLCEERKHAIQQLTADKEQIRLLAQEFWEQKLDQKDKEMHELKQKLVDEIMVANKDLLQAEEQCQQVRTDFERKLEQKGEEMHELKQKLFRENEELVDEIMVANKDLLQAEEQCLQVSTDLAEKERRLAELTVKDAELHNLKIQIHEKDVRIDELLALSKEEEKQLVELRSSLEARETEINALKKLLEDKVKEYEVVENALKKDVSIMAASTTESTESTSTEGKESASQELDLALYMLHQRDVRCEELTHELMQLLEERDTLQLRLSNAIRVNEDLKRVGSSDLSPKDVSSASGSEEPVVEHPSPSKSVGPVEIAKEAIDAPIGEDREALAEKLSQLHTVSHTKDVRLMDERELRHTQQMSLLAHKDVLSTLPPEAAARLVNANYTLSRDVQSQSSVLLNWLWGKSTPKVVHM